MSTIDIIEEHCKHLSTIAYYWRGYRSQNNDEICNALVEEYHAVVKVLKLLGWKGERLLPDEELPNELMPEI